jgi:ribose 5-phosphate isomerase
VTVDDRPFVTDMITDPWIEPTDDAPALERSIRSIPGVVDTGLFPEGFDRAAIDQAIHTLRKALGTDPDAQRRR